MKFGKQLESYKIPEWFEYYLDYNGIKTILKFLDNRPSKRKKLKKLKMIKLKYDKYQKTKASNESKRKVSIFSNESTSLIVASSHKLKKYKSKRKRIIEAEDLSSLPDEEKIANFTNIYRNKIKIVDEFFTNKLQEFLGELNRIEFKINSLDTSSSSEESYVGEKKSEADDIGYAVSWKRALSSLYNQTSWLHSYHSINSLAVLKIKKKSIKIFKLNDIEIEENLEKVSKEFDFFGKSLKVLVNLRARIKHLYSIKFNKGNEKETNHELENRLHGETKKKRISFICLYIGLLIAFIFCYVIFKIIDGKNTNDSFKPFFPFFNFSYIMILVLALVGTNMIILEHYKINYVYIFDLGPKNKVSPYQVFEGVFGLSALWMFFFLMTKLALKFQLFGGEYTLFPLLMNTSLVVILFLPFHIFYLNFRKGILKVIICVIFPIGKNSVRFKHSLFGDILISLSEPFKNLLLGYCLMVCKECYLTNTRGHCNKETIPCWLISAYPQFIRLTQNINRYYYTRICWPHIGNAIKYAIRFVNTSMGFFYERDKGTVRFYFRVFIGAISSLYNILWDIYIDWGLLRKNNKYYLLREKITYPRIVYYFAMIYDLLIRASWTWYFIPLRSSLLEWKSLLKDTLEVIRRGLWALIRIENENVTNPEYYRSFLIIPDIPMTDDY
jgi:hypothetical protein